jgi:hypothetical protein
MNIPAETLQAFCFRDHYRLCKPFQRGEYTYATNGRIGLRLPTADVPPELELAEGVDTIEQLNWDRPDTEPIPLPSTEGEKSKPCKECEGNGYVKKCRECDGYGEEVCYACGHEDTCRACDGDGTFASHKENPDATPCEDCHGTGKIGIETAIPLAHGVHANDRYLRLIGAHLTDVLLYPIPGKMDSGSSHPIYFTFTEGDGILMPIIP